MPEWPRDHPLTSTARLPPSATSTIAGFVRFGLTSPYHGFRFPKAIIQHAIWLYLRFTLSLRDVEELLAAAGGE